MFYGIIFAVLAASVTNAEDLAARNPLCKARNAYYPIAGSCDSYVECREYTASEMLCPDGLHYNSEAPWPAYPCGYPMDVPCKERESPQPAKSTADCPHQYGFYPSPLASINNCAPYRMCVDGRPIEMVCPPGLAFNSATSHCDWPDQVPSCNADAFLGFKCPATRLSINGEPIDEVRNYKYEGSCYGFFSCSGGHARLLSCDFGFAFDSQSGRCEDASHVVCDSPPPKV